MDSLPFFVLVLLLNNNVCESKDSVPVHQENNLFPYDDIQRFKDAIDFLVKEEKGKEPLDTVLIHMNSTKNITELYNGCGKSKSCIGFPENCLKQMNCTLFLSRQVSTFRNVNILRNKQELLGS